MKYFILIFLTGRISGQGSEFSQPEIKLETCEIKLAAIEARVEFLENTELASKIDELR